jgi:hypothetical protein
LSAAHPITASDKDGGLEERRGPDARIQAQHGEVNDAHAGVCMP